MNIADLKLGVYEKAIPIQLDWNEKLALAKKSNYDFVELSVDGLDPRIKRLDWDNGEISAIRRAVEKTGVPILTMAMTANRYFPLGDERPDIRDKGIEIVKKSVNLAVKLGIRLIQLATYDVFGRNGDDKTDLLFRQAIDICAEYAAKNAVMLAFEVMDCPYSNSSEKLLYLMSGVDSPYVQIYYDSGNPAAAGYDPAQDVLKAGSRVVAVHLKDAVPGCCRKIPYDKGIVDFEAFFSSLINMRYSGLLVAEMWSDENIDFIPYLETASRFLREKIRRVSSAVTEKGMMPL